MMKKVTVAALFLSIAFLPLTGVAAGDPSYFEGVWVGSWPSWKSSSMVQDVTVEIRRGNVEGVFLVDYAWGGGPHGSGFPPQPGSINAKGKEEGDQFIFEWSSKQGKDMKVILKKYEANKAKAKLEKSGLMGRHERPTNETVLNRK